MEKIPKIIHQIWSGIDEPLPAHFTMFGETWKRDYPDWQYEFWDNERMNSFIDDNYPQFKEIYDSFPYNIQRWDAIRYLILDKIGGMYVDFDYESIEPMDILIEGQTCCFAMEPENHIKMFNGQTCFNNAMMLSVPGHRFMKKIIADVFSAKNLVPPTLNKTFNVLNSTGPYMLYRVYNDLSETEKNGIYLIPAKYVSPLDMYRCRILMGGELNKEQGEEFEKYLEDARAIHYFFGQWNI